jgi:CheY-like chemotaxis protein
VPIEVRRILIVDDDMQLVGLFARMLASTGENYTIFKAFSGEEALQSLSLEPVDLVLLDLVLPGDSGLDVLHAIKANPDLANVAVIMVSAQYPEELISTQPLSLSLYRREHASLTETLSYLRAVVEAFPKGNLSLTEDSPTPPEAAGVEPVS